jgi:hypothetical protein
VFEAMFEVGEGFVEGFDKPVKLPFLVGRIYQYPRRCNIHSHFVSVSRVDIKTYLGHLDGAFEFIVSQTRPDFDSHRDECFRDFDLCKMVGSHILM